VLLQLPVLERVVASAGRSIDARLMAVLHSSGELSRHCQAIRRYLLMGQVGVEVKFLQGDFVVALLDVLGSFLLAFREADITSSPVLLAHPVCSLSLCSNSCRVTL
jgi:hypothetical protein